MLKSFAAGKLRGDRTVCLDESPGWRHNLNRDRLNDDDLIVRHLQHREPSTAVRAFDCLRNGDRGFIIHRWHQWGSPTT